MLDVVNWLIQHTISSIHGKRRLSIRYDRHDDIHEAFFGLAACLTTCTNSQISWRGQTKPDLTRP